MTYREEPTKERLNELFEYRNGNLFWKKKSSPKSHIKIGDKAGCNGGDGYRNIRVDMVIYKAHRLIWIFFNGTIPFGKEIDHKFGEKGDDRIENLRIGTPSNNQHNRPKNKTNRSGYKGVYFHTNNGKPVARIQVNGVNKHIGMFDTVEEAHEAYKREAIIHHKEFARF